jgi:hypothetical protein
MLAESAVPVKIKGWAWGRMILPYRTFFPDYYHLFANPERASYSEQSKES